MKPAEKVRELIDFFNDKTHWTRYTYSREDENGKVSYCLSGALVEVVRDDSGKLDAILNSYIRRCGWDHIEEFNDTCGYHAVMDFLNSVLCHQEGKGVFPYTKFEKPKVLKETTDES